MVCVITRTNTEPPMLALADPPTPQGQPETGLIPGLKYSPAWHREQEDLEQALLNEYARWCRRFRPFPQDGPGERP